MPDIWPLKMSNSKIMQERARQSAKIQDESVAMEFHNRKEKWYERSEKTTAGDSPTIKKVALLEMRSKVEEAILGNRLLGEPDTKLAPSEQEVKKVSLWGVPLLPSSDHEGTDVVLLKFLKAKDYKVHEAFEMLQKTLQWRRQYRADEILEEKLGPLHLSSADKEGHPLFYEGALGDRDMYWQKLEGEEINHDRFMRWIVQDMEKAITELKFEARGADSVLQITDFKNSPKPGMREMLSFSRKARELLQEHYPGLIHKTIVINAPLWFHVSKLLSSRVRRSKGRSKFVFAKPSKEAETLLKFISPENLPVEYGGLNRENDEVFCREDKASELLVRANGQGRIQIPVLEVGVTIMWEATVVGWDISYEEEFIPEDEGSYKVLVRQEKDKRGGENIRNSFYIREPGKILITIDNGTLRKKRVFYRHKIKITTVPVFNCTKNKQ